MDISLEDLTLRFKTYFEKEYGKQVRNGDVEALAAFYYAFIRGHNETKKNIAIVANYSMCRFKVYFIHDGELVPLVLPPYLKEKHMVRYANTGWHFFSNANETDRVLCATNSFIGEMHEASRLQANWIQLRMQYIVSI